MALQIGDFPAHTLTETELEAWRGIPAAIASDELNRGSTPDAGLKPITRHVSLAGLAFTVRAMAGDNLALHHAVARALPGSVLMIDAGGYDRNAVWGGILHKAAQMRGIAGVVVDGCIRDVAEIRSSPVACYARGAVPAGPHKGWGGEIGGTIQLGGAVVRAGDLVIGDADGLAIVPYAERAAVLDLCRKRIAMEHEMLRRIEAGETTVEIMGL
jgi:regulator of RNase E activity RraA